MKKPIELEVNRLGVTIHALSAAGVFYGCQTLRQLVEPGTREVPFVVIEDAPALRVARLDAGCQPAFLR